MRLVKEEVNQLMWWIRERIMIMTKRAKGAPKPWTNDPVLQRYRFTNVRRNWDHTSIYIHNKLDYPLTPTRMAFACAVARRVNKIETLQAIGFPRCVVRWKPDEIKRQMHVLKSNGQTVFGAAYMMMGGVTGDLIDATVDDILTPIVDTLWKSMDPKSLLKSYEAVQGFNCMGTFVAGQIVMDCHAVGLIEPDDLFTWAPIGPGSMFGLNILYGRDKKHRITAERAAFEFRDLYGIVQPRLPVLVRDMPLYDLEHCVCEFYKWRSGGGKQRFDGEGR